MTNVTELPRLVVDPRLWGPAPPPGVSELPESYNAAADLLGGGTGAPTERSALISAPPELREMSYAELEDLSSRSAGLLAAHGVRRGDRVALVADDGVAWIAAFLGAVRAGYVAVPLSFMFAPDLLAGALAVTRPAAVLTDPPRRELVDAAFKRAGPSLAPLVRLLGEPWTRDVAAADRGPAAATLADEPAVILFTSGTTGHPKGAVHAHRDLPVARCFADVMDYTSGDRLYTTSKLSFAFSLGSTLSSAMSVGASVVVSPGRPTPERIAEVVRATRPTAMASVPTLYARLTRARLDPEDFSSLRVCTAAGESLPPEIARRFTNRFGTGVLEHIGATEYIHPFAATWPGCAMPGSVGQVMPGVEAVLLADGEPVGTGEPGDLWIRGPSVMDGYLCQRDATRRAVVGGWLRTGDVAEVDEDGFLTIRGRSDEIINVGGVKLAPAEAEHVLINHPAVAEVAVVGAIHPDGLSQPWAYVVPAPGYEPGEGLAQELRDWARQRGSRHAWPRRVVFIDSLPRTATGKIQRFRLAEDALQRVSVGGAEKA